MARRDLLDKLVARDVDDDAKALARDTRALIFVMNGEKRPRTSVYLAHRARLSVARVEEILAQLERDGDVHSKGGDAALDVLTKGTDDETA